MYSILAAEFPYIDKVNSSPEMFALRVQNAERWKLARDAEWEKVQSLKRAIRTPPACWRQWQHEAAGLANEGAGAGLRGEGGRGAGGAR